MEDRLAVVVSETGLQGPNAESLLLAFRPFFGKAQALVEAAAAINVTDATQVTEMKNARASRLALRAVRVEVEAARKTMKEDSLRTGRAIDGMANVLKFLIEPAENRLEEMEKFAERKEAERKAALKSGREDLLRPFGIDTSAYMLGEMKQETFAELLNATRVAHEAKVAAAQKAEVERIAAEAARTAEEKRVRDENERLRQEAVAAEAARKAEREKLEAEARKEREKAEAERRAAEAKAAAERAAADKKLAEERAAREKLEREAAELEVKSAAHELQDALGKPGANVFELASDFSVRLSVVQGRAEDPPPVFSVDALVSELKSTPEGLVSGWSAVDDLGVRFQPKELAVLGARTGHGKTSALVNLAHAWLDKKLDGPLVFFSHEEPSELVFCRLVALLTAGETSRWTFAEVRDYLRSPRSRGDSYGWPDARVLGRATDRLRAAEARLHLVHRPGWSVGRISAHARELAGTRGVGAVFVDYVQRIPAEAKADRRDIEVSAIGRALKALAVDLSVPVVAGAQINREAIPDKYQATIRKALEKGVSEAVGAMKSARPDLHNLREGGSEQEADLVLGLMNYAADLRTEADSDHATNLYEVGVLKNRYGDVGKWAALAFEGASGLIRDRRQGEGLGKDLFPDAAKGRKR